MKRWFARKRRSAADALDFNLQLESIPVRNQRVRLVEESETRGVFEIDLTYRGLLARLRRPLGLCTARQFGLEGVGLDLFRQIDDRRRVVDLVDAFSSRHQLSFFEARTLVVQYLGILMKAGLIVVAVRERGAGIDGVAEV